jgi:magnesium transporter
MFLAQVLNRPVVDAAGRRLGWVEDLVLSRLDLFPRVEALVLARRGKGAAFIPWEHIRRLDGSVVQLGLQRDALPSPPVPEDAIFLRRDILDKQVVDIHGRKVVRVNDLQLAPVDAELRLIGADIGVSGLLRRLSLERPVRAVAHLIDRPLPSHIIPWNYIEGLETEWTSVRLNVSHRRLRELPPTDIADILQQLHRDEREEIVQHFDDETLADTLPHLDEDLQAEVIMALPDERASDILEILPPDEAADVLGDLTEQRAARLLGLMEPDDAADVRTLMLYDDETAGGRMTTEYLSFAQELTAGQALEALRAQAPDAETIYYVYVTSVAGHLEGVLSLRDLITAPAATPLATLTQRDVIRVHVDDDQEAVARLLNHYHLLAVPVVDDDGILRGIVTVDDVLDVMHEEAEEDVSRLAGAVEESDVLTTPWEQVGARLPWALAMLLVGGGVTYLLHEGPGHSLAATTVLLGLLPLLLVLGVHIGGFGAAATQVALQDGYTLGEILRAQLRGQWLVGALLGAGAGLVSALFTYWGDQAAQPAAVGFVVWGVLLADMLIGSLLPILLHRLQWDPILISRPALAMITLIIGVPLLVQVL